MARKNEDIELLRAVAILLTLVAHIGILLPYDSTIYAFLIKNLEPSVGVDLFFVISGFVITQSLASTASEREYGRRYLMQAFWIKRIFRLLPAAWLWLFIGVLVYLALGTLAENYVPTIAALLNVMNVYWIFCSPSGEALSFCTGTWHLNGHYWSLSLEEQFYLIYPLLFFFVSRRLLVGMLVCFIVVNLFWERPIWSLGWLIRMDAIAWGVLLGLLYDRAYYRKPADLFDSNRTLLFLIFVALVIAMPVVAEHVLGLSGRNTEVFGVGLIAFIGAILVWLASYDLNLFTLSGRASSLMLYFGARSYSLYLTHLVVFRVLHLVFTDFAGVDVFARHTVLVNIFMIVVGVAVSVLTCEMTYRFIETPCRRKGRLLADGLLQKRRVPQSGQADLG